MQKVGFMGLGAMGSRMARRLLEHGCKLTVYNRTQSKAAPLVESGATLTRTPRETAENADFLFSMIDNDETSRALWLGDDGALSGIKPGAVLMECSTLSPAWIEELYALAVDQGCELLDAPVGGSIGPAERGELLIMAGGSVEALERARPVLEPLSNAIQHLGPSGSGAKLKLIHNMMLAAHAANLAEGLVLAQRAGLNVEQVAQVVSNGGPNSRVVQMCAPLMTSGDYGETNFALRLLSKDVDYAMDFAGTLGVELGLTRSAAQYYRGADDDGLGELEFAAVYESIKNHIGT